MRRHLASGRLHKSITELHDKEHNKPCALKARFSVSGSNCRPRDVMFAPRMAIINVKINSYVLSPFPARVR
ncbi:UNVERIFIED_ORG: hypothetical protein J2W85_001153 [Ensifer adhaerens]|nr:hypothetical protein [Ensifer adhaerens]